MKLLFAVLFVISLHAQTPQVLPPVPPEVTPSPIPVSPMAPTRTIWDIKSPFDLFTIEVMSEGMGRLNGQEVSLAPLNRYVSVFGREFFEDCPRFEKKATIEIVQSLGSKHRTWQLYPEAGIFVQNGKCLKVSIEDAYQFPVHRQWFTGPDVAEIDLGARFTFTMGGRQAVFVKRKGVWRAVDGKANSKLLKQFIQIIGRFRISARSFRRAPADAPTFTIKVGEKSYRFHKISSRDWALELESSDWLVISSDSRALNEISAESLLTATE